MYVESFRLHTKWLKTAQVNVSVPFQAAEGASNHLEQLSDLTKNFLEKVRATVWLEFTESACFLERKSTENDTQEMSYTLI